MKYKFAIIIQFMLSIYAPLMLSDAGYCDRYYRSVVRPSVTLVHPAKAVSGTNETSTQRIDKKADNLDDVFVRIVLQNVSVNMPIICDDLQCKC